MNPIEFIHLFEKTPAEVDAFLASHSIPFRRMEGSGLLVLIDDVETGAGRTQADGDHYVAFDTVARMAIFAPAEDVEGGSPEPAGEGEGEADEELVARADAIFADDFLLKLCRIHTMSMQERREIADIARKVYEREHGSVDNVD